MTAVSPSGRKMISTGESFPVGMVATTSRLLVETRVRLLSEKSEVIASSPSGVSSTPFGHAPESRIATRRRERPSAGGAATFGAAGAGESIAIFGAGVGFGFGAGFAITAFF